MNNSIDFDKKLSMLANDLGIIKAFLFAASAVLYLITDYHIFRVLYLITSLYFLVSTLFMVFNLVFINFISTQLKDALVRACVHSCKFNVEFFVYYFIVSIGVLAPFLFNGEEVSRSYSLIFLFFEIIMIYKSFSVARQHRLGE